MSNFLIRHSGYKRTTDKQYSLLTHEMARFSVEHRSGKKVDAIVHWNILTEKLNALGPPYRTVQQWKKVWTDFRRFHTKKDFKSTPKFKKRMKNGNHQDNEIYQPEVEVKEEVSESNDRPATSSKVAQFLRSEWEDYDEEHNSESKHSSNSNDYVDEYSYPDRHSTQQSDGELHEILIPDQSPYDMYHYTSNDEPPPISHASRNLASIGSQVPPPPLQASNTRALDQTLYNLQNQLEHQTKLLEHMSQISSTMAGLMERQVNAVEKQAEAMRRQASATEHHTLVMNSFVDMIREKMPKANSKTSNKSSTNASNGSL